MHSACNVWNKNKKFEH